MEQFDIDDRQNAVSNGIHRPTTHSNSASECNGYHTYNATMSKEAASIGIIGAEFYFPRSYVDQKDLEKFDNVSTNKYTTGLGQSEMCFCHENEDVCSMALSATSALLENYKVDPCTIGFLAVGTETLIDRSKSIKSVLMDLFAASGNTDLEGVDEKNACFGGTQALFHAVDWMRANYAMERRLAIVVSVDNAIYAQGPARCTGGAGAIAFLIAPNAPIVFEHGLRAFHSSNVYDFYKPHGGNSTEYPKVDGPNSVEIYLQSLDKCYKSYEEKWTRLFGSSALRCSLDNFYAVLFHSPYTRLTQKAFAWLSFVDFKNNSTCDPSRWEELSSYKEMSLEEILKMEKTKTRTNKQDRFTDKAMEASAMAAEMKLNPHLEFGRRIGNMYTPSLYAQLMNVFLNTPFTPDLHQKRILLFSYGSGCVAAIYSLSFDFSLSKADAYAAIRKSAQRAYERLDARIKYSPEQFTEILKVRERIISDGETYSAPEKAVDMGPLFPGSFYLQEIDSGLRRFYKRID